MLIKDGFLGPSLMGVRGYGDQMNQSLFRALSYYLAVVIEVGVF